MSTIEEELARLGQISGFGFAFAQDRFFSTAGKNLWEIK